MNNMDLLVIGFDGADYELMNNLVDEGELPNLQKLMEEGSYAELESTAIPITPSAWTTFMTGKNPGKHGIFDFTKVTPKGLEIVSFADVEDDTIFEIVDDKNIVGTLNIPATYPARDINGFMVSGMMSPSIEQSTNDEEVKHILEEQNYNIEVPGTYNGNNEEKLLKQCYDTIDVRQNTALELMRKKDLDVFMPVFTVGDRISHWFWKYHDPQHPEFEESDYRDEVKKIYKQIDENIGELIEEAGGLGNTNVAVMSDHGFTGLYYGVNLNKLFMKNDMLRIKKNPISLSRYTGFELGVTMENAYKIVRKLGMEEVVKSAADNPEDDKMRKILSSPFLSFTDIDFEKSEAYSALHFGPIFTLKDDSEEKVVELLRDLEHQGKKVVEDIVRGKDIYHGRNADKAPDIVYHSKGMHYQAHRYFEFGTNKVFTEPFNTESGHHRLEGIFVAAGPDIENIGEIKDAHIMDVAPTLLTVMDYAVPADMDGSPLDIAVNDFEYNETAISDF